MTDVRYLSWGFQDETPCDFVEVALSDCPSGCKVYQCKTHTVTWADGSVHSHKQVIHSAIYGCREGQFSLYRALREETAKQDIKTLLLTLQEAEQLSEVMDREPEVNEDLAERLSKVQNDEGFVSSMTGFSPEELTDLGGL